jgi:hypothetical protein
MTILFVLMPDGGGRWWLRFPFVHVQRFLCVAYSRRRCENSVDFCPLYLEFIFSG